jgi:CubicO group peptidase (beta-lactamase class C family)
MCCVPRALIVAMVVLSLTALPTSAYPDAVDRIFARANFTGLVRVRRGPDSTVASSDWGYANEQHRVPMSANALFPIGSNTKTMTATSIYQLHERGVLNITDNIADYLDASDLAAFGLNATTYCPLLAGNTSCQVITFEHLLAMSAGIPGNAVLMTYPYLGSISGELGQYLSQPLLFAPGTSFFYSNPSFMLAGYFIQKYTGKSLNEYFRDHLWTPLGLSERTYYDPYNGKYRLQPDRVGEYYRYLSADTQTVHDVGVCSTELDLGNANAAGGAIGQIDDLATWYFRLFNFTGDKHPLFKSMDTLIRMVQPRTLSPGTNRWFAQGVWVIKARKTMGWTKPYPPVIFYEGDTICVSTANFLDVSVEPPLLTQAWQSATVFYVNATTYAAAATARSGFFFDTTGTWNGPAATHDLAWAAHDVFAPAIEYA